MPRPRNPENRGLPPRWIKQHGAYYYCVPLNLTHQWDNKKLFRLGVSLSDAHRKWADRVDAPQDVLIINQLLDRYMLEVSPTKKPATHFSETKSVAHLRRTWGDWPITSITPQAVYHYIDKRTAKNQARLERALISHAFTKAVEWGYIPKHPFKGEVRVQGSKSRERYIEDWELRECYKLAPKRDGNDATRFLQAYIKVKLLTGLRKSDMLRLKVTDFTEAGIPLTTSKTGKSIIISWTPALRAAIEEAKALRPVDIAPWLFCNRRGESYIDEATGQPTGFDSCWQRFMGRLIAETDLKKRFTEHDIRAKAGSDAGSDADAQKLLTHENVGMTRRAYRRRAEVVTPLY